MIESLEQEGVSKEAFVAACQQVIKGFDLEYDKQKTQTFLTKFYEVFHFRRDQSRTCCNSVSLKVTRHGRHFVPQCLREGQNGMCFNRVSCKLDKV